MTVTQFNSRIEGAYVVSVSLLTHKKNLNSVKLHFQGQKASDTSPFFFAWNVVHADYCDISCEFYIITYIYKHCTVDRDVAVAES